jgi:1,4-dihydroxy-2-naphthoyl-CoA hydrolase
VAEPPPPDGVTGPRDTVVPVDDASPFVAAAGLQITGVESHGVEGFIDLGPEHHQPWGIVHGGVYTSAIETAASIGASTAAARTGMIAVGVHNSTDFLRPMRAGRVRVVGRPIQQGRIQQLWEVRITDTDDRLVAIGQVRLQNIAPRPA